VLDEKMKSYEEKSPSVLEKKSRTGLRLVWMKELTVG
jgi:hypothetical protein